MGVGVNGLTGGLVFGKATTKISIIFWTRGSEVSCEGVPKEDTESVFVFVQNGAPESTETVVGGGVANGVG